MSRDSESEISNIPAIACPMESRLESYCNEARRKRQLNDDLSDELQDLELCIRDVAYDLGKEGSKAAKNASVLQSSVQSID